MWQSQGNTWISPSLREDWCLVWDLPAAHNWSPSSSMQPSQNCIYGNLQHLCKSTGRRWTLNWIFPAGWSDIPHFTRQHGRNSVLFFGDRVISKGLWPPRSPDLTPPDYFLWGYLKGRVYRNKPRTTDALKANIIEEIHAVTADVLARNFQNMARRVQSCLDANGGHFQHMLWCRHISYTMR